MVYKYRCIDVCEVYVDVSVLSVYLYDVYGVVCGMYGICVLFV